MAGRKRHEEHANHEAWAIPYGDLVTLLLAFFVVMYAISQVNEGKYRVLADALKAEFTGQPTALDPVQVGKDKLSAAPDASSPIAMTRQGAEPQVVEIIRSNSASSQAPERRKRLDQVADRLETAMSNLIRDKLVTVRRGALWVEVEIKTDILFSSGSAALSPLAASVLQPVADALRASDNAIRVEGHTDNVPINTREFPSNWELSAGRAATVVHLFESRGLQPARLTVIGYGEYRPAQPNDNAQGRDANRRVVIVILDNEAGSAASE